MKDFLKDSAKVVIYTMAETALGVIGTSTMIQQVDWKVMCSIVALAGIVTILKCIVAKFKDDKDADFIMEDEEDDEEEDDDDDME